MVGVIRYLQHTKYRGTVPDEVPNLPANLGITPNHTNRGTTVSLRRKETVLRRGAPHNTHLIGPAIKGTERAAERETR